MLQEVIRRVPLFSTLPARHLRWLADSLQPHDILDGTQLFAEGEEGNALYIIIQGEVELLKRTETGGESLIAVRGPGEYIGEMSLLHPQGRRTASARARGDGEVLAMSRADFDALLNRYPPMGYQLARVLGERLEQAHASSIHDLEERNRALQDALEQLHAAQAQLIETRKLEHELALAREIQLSLLPPALPRVPGYDFGARLLPMMQVGGDFYDVIPLDDSHIGVAVGDVSGHGVPAALIMAITVALLRAEACSGCAPAQVLTALNRHLIKLGTHRMFVTALYGALDTTSGEFTYARAGHEPPLLAGRKGSDPCYYLGGEGRLLGMFHEVRLDNATLTLAPRESLVLYTDGVIEARNREREFFGEERLSELAARNALAPAQALCDQIVAGVLAHTGEPAQADDITVVSVRKT